MHLTGTGQSMVGRLAQLTLDVQDVARQADFWSAVLGLRADHGPIGPAGLPAQSNRAHVADRVAATVVSAKRAMVVTAATGSAVDRWASPSVETSTMSAFLPGVNDPVA